MNNRPINFSWLLLMAWRDSRRNRSRLFLFISSIILGIGALVAIYSLGENLKQNVDQQAATLIGADLEISSNRLPLNHVQEMIDSLGDRRSHERSFASMIYFKKNNGTRLVQIRALEGGFPYYGELQTLPIEAAQSFREKRAALVDQTLMLQYDAKPGDSIAIGDLSFIIEGILKKAPGQSGLSASVAPAVYIPMRFLAETGLEQKGSRINYRYYFKFDKPVNIDKITDRLLPVFDKEDLDYETVASQKEDTGRSFEDLTQFLSLVGFIALLLGCIGVASAIHIYIREKIGMIAVLRCLGVKAWQTFLIFLIQIVGIGILGSLIGAALGTLIQQVLPVVLEDLLPIEIDTPVSWNAIIQGIGVGVLISVLFALLPLISIRNISPLNTLRMSFQEKEQRRDPLRMVIYGLILFFIFIFTFLHLNNFRQSVFFTLGICVAFLILTGIASLLIYLVRRFFPVSWSYLWRQGLSNLFRPNNQTVILIVCIGLGTAFICTLFFVQNILLNRVTLTAGDNQPNIVLFDIQSEQKEQVVQMAADFKLPAGPTVPIVNMRLEEINGLTAEEAMEDTSSDMSRRVFSREYRVTFRDTLTPYEKITEGKWSGNANGTAVYISMEEGWAKRANIDIGDTLTFNVQGALIPTIVGSFREVDWNRVQTNFLVVFPRGVLEQAPQFHVLLTRVPSNEVSAAFQQAVVRRFPNVSIIDLALILSVLDEILDKIAFVIRFIAGFSIITGLVVLIASVLISKYQRIQESVLLRTLGASSKQIFAITALEYFFLGAFASVTGIILSLAGSWALAHYSFETTFTPQWFIILTVFFSVCALTVFIGLINSREILTRPPLEILRQEV